jgi:hypothetical protein
MSFASAEVLSLPMRSLPWHPCLARGQRSLSGFLPSRTLTLLRRFRQPLQSESRLDELLGVIATQRPNLTNSVVKTLQRLRHDGLEPRGFLNRTA